MSLYISVTTASSTLSDSPINSAITTMAAKVAGAKKFGRMPVGPALDVTFMLPGQEDKPSFTGMRMGGYTSEGDTLYFETAVPQRMIYSQQADIYVAMVMEDVVVNAEAFFKDNEVDFDALQWQLCVAQLADTESQAVGMH